VVSNTKLMSHRGEARVGRPELQAPHNSGREEVNIDPAHAATLQVVIANEHDDLTVRNKTGLMHPLIAHQKLSTASSVADEEFPENEFVPRHFIETEKSV